MSTKKKAIPKNWKSATKKAPAKKTKPKTVEGSLSAAFREAGDVHGISDPPEAPASATKGECPKGGNHVWMHENGEAFCTQCFEPKPKATKKGGKKPARIESPVGAAEAGLVDQIVAAVPDDAKEPRGPLGDNKPAAKKKANAETPTVANDVGPTTQPPAKAKKNAKAKPDAATKKTSALDAAAMVLKDSTDGMNAKDLINAMSTSGLWTSQISPRRVQARSLPSGRNASPPTSRTQSSGSAIVLRP